MHELSIAMSIVEIAEEEAERRGLSAIRAVHLKLGALSGVVKEALLSAYELAREGSRIEAAPLVVQDIPVVIHCAACGGESSVDSIQHLGCRRCGTLASEVISGRELELVGLEVDT